LASIFALRERQTEAATHKLKTNTTSEHEKNDQPKLAGPRTCPARAPGRLLPHLYVNRSQVIDANIGASNGTVHGINQVLLPPSK